jgi:ubiquitin
MTLENLAEAYEARISAILAEMVNISNDLCDCELAGKFHAEYYDDLDRLEALQERRKSLRESRALELKMAKGINV